MLAPEAIATIEKGIEQPWNATEAEHRRWIRWLLEERRMQGAVLNNMMDNLLREHDITTTLGRALSKVLAWMTNVNTAEPREIAAVVIEALKAAGHDAKTLDAAAVAMLAGAAHIGE
jgi:hypothetical protein